MAIVPVNYNTNFGTTTNNHNTSSVEKPSSKMPTSSVFNISATDDETDYFMGDNSPSWFEEDVFTEILPSLANNTLDINSDSIITSDVMNFDKPLTSFALDEPNISSVIAVGATAGVVSAEPLLPAFVRGASKAFQAFPHPLAKTLGFLASAGVAGYLLSDSNDESEKLAVLGDGKLSGASIDQPPYDTSPSIFPSTGGSKVWGYEGSEKEIPTSWGTANESPDVLSDIPKGYEFPSDSSFNISKMYSTEDESDSKEILGDFTTNYKEWQKVESSHLGIELGDGGNKVADEYLLIKDVAFVSVKYEVGDSLSRLAEKLIFENDSLVVADKEFGIESNVPLGYALSPEGYPGFFAKRLYGAQSVDDIHLVTEKGLILEAHFDSKFAGQFTHESLSKLEDMKKVMTEKHLTVGGEFQVLFDVETGVAIPKLMDAHGVKSIEVFDGNEPAYGLDMEDLGQVTKDAIEGPLSHLEDLTRIDEVILATKYAIEGQYYDVESGERVEIKAGNGNK